MKCKVCLSSLDSTPLILNAILVHGQWDRTAQGLRRPWLVVEAGLGELLFMEELESPSRESYLPISVFQQLWQEKRQLRTRVKC